MAVEKKITGIILCGGKSSRMGKNKALLKINNKPLISYVIELLQKYCVEIILSTNMDDLNYLNLPIVKDEQNNIGPISGIYSALKKSTNQISFILSCDTPFFSSQLIEDMLAASKNYEIVLPELNGKLQPMTGIFKKSILPIIEREIRSGNYVPPSIFEKCNLNKFKITELQSIYPAHTFFNVNNPVDYEKAKEIYKKIKD